MSNIGHTVIVATGPQDSQRALLAHLGRAAPDGITPTLSGLLDALKAAARITRRFPALRVTASYTAQGALTTFSRPGLRGQHPRL